MQQIAAQDGPELGSPPKHKRNKTRFKRRKNTPKLHPWSRQRAECSSGEQTLRRRLSHFWSWHLWVSSSALVAFRTPILVVNNTGYISVFRRVAFCDVFSLSLSFSLYIFPFPSSRPGVNFLSRPVCDPEHSLPHSFPTSRHHAAPPSGPASGWSRHEQERHTHTTTTYLYKYSTYSSLSNASQFKIICLIFMCNSDKLQHRLNLSVYLIPSINTGLGFGYIYFLLHCCFFCYFCFQCTSLSK